jgi:UDP-N-acetylmuramoyl-tripeptide--D-alanyl-D-alanine ligase
LASNALAAAAVALELGVPLDKVAQALGAARPVSRWRMETHERADGVIVVNDAYNANPDSMRAAISALAAMRRNAQDGRCWAVLGQMAELGEESNDAHREVGAAVAKAGVDKLVAVGSAARGIAEGAAAQGFSSSDIFCVSDVEAAVEVLANARAGDVVLVKASRAAALERVARRLLGDREEAGE